jgi:undecaprenyl diphosphate synthase
VAFIIDGNGRWAMQRNLERHAGHRAGANVTVEIAKHAFSIPGINCVTLYLFSTENWSRPMIEVTNIMHLLERYLLEVSSYLIENEIRLVVIGQSYRLPQSCQALISQLSRETAKKGAEKRTLCLALSYGGRDDIVQACKSIIDMRINSENVDEEVFASLTATGRHGVPDPDLLIRTSGESRLSNFLLWQSAYSELEFVDCCWPDFTTNEFDACLLRYSRRPRRFGGVGA